MTKPAGRVYVVTIAAALASLVASASATAVPPVCQDTTHTVQAGQALSLTPSCSDPQGRTLSYFAATLPANGVLYAAPGGGSTYYSRAGFVGVDTFTYGATAPIDTPPGYEESNHATVTITVVPAPSVPSPQSRRKPRVLREYPPGGRKLAVRRDRLVTYKDVSLKCDDSDDKACVAHGYLSALRVVGNSELRSPILGRYRLQADAGKTVPISVKLSRFGLRYVKRHDPLEVYLVIRYAIKGQEEPGCTEVCKEKRSSFRATLRYRG
jgi:Bacterial Ig domain